MNNNQCIKCAGVINGEFFTGQNGKLCAECLKYLCVYNVLKKYGLIQEATK